MPVVRATANPNDMDSKTKATASAARGIMSRMRVPPSAVCRPRRGGSLRGVFLRFGAVTRREEHLDDRIGDRREHCKRDDDDRQRCHDGELPGRGFPRRAKATRSTMSMPVNPTIAQTQLAFEPSPFQRSCAAMTCAGAGPCPPEAPPAIRSAIAVTALTTPASYCSARTDELRFFAIEPAIAGAMG